VTHHDIEELLGAYALDAVDDDEARQVEAHLRECPRCRAEVAAHREVAALLISSSTHPVPDGVWDRIAAELGEVPPPVPIEVAFGERRAPRRGVLTGLAVAAAIALIAVVGAVLVSGGGGTADDEQLALLLRDPDTEVVELQTPEGAAGARAVIGEDGDSVLVPTDLPALGTGQTYQLWGLPGGRDEMVSLGVLGAEPDQQEFHVEGGVTALAISREPGGGSTQPTTDPVVTGSVGATP
jgi:anti-sigma factor RsiW